MEGGEGLVFKHRIERYVVHGRMIIISSGKNLYIYKNMQEEVEEEYSNKRFSLLQHINKTTYLLAAFCQFTQHKSRIIHVGITRNGMIVSIDEEIKVYIF